MRLAQWVLFEGAQLWEARQRRNTPSDKIDMKRRIDEERRGNLTNGNQIKPNQRNEEKRVNLTNGNQIKRNQRNAGRVENSNKMAKKSDLV